MVSTLSAHDVIHDYPESGRAVDGVELDLAEGELVCLLGPNGSGKSTLLRLLGGVLSPTAGSITLDGHPLNALGTRARARRIAAVPQVLRALPELAVETFVLSGRYSHFGFFARAGRADREVVRRALAQTDTEIVHLRSPREVAEWTARVGDR